MEFIETKPLANMIVNQHREVLTQIKAFYREINYNQPVFMKIETGISRRTWITPEAAIYLWDKDKGNEKVAGLSRKEFFDHLLDPLNLISHLMEDEMILCSVLLATLKPNDAIVLIDYEGEEIREFFEPVVVNFA